jgi:hypothetical protein
MGQVAATDFHTAVLLPAAREAALAAPIGCHLHFITLQDWFITVLMRGREARIASRYRKSGGKKPLSYREDWIALDEVLSARSITASASRPMTDRARYILEATVETSAQGTRNMNRRFGDWDL